MSYVIMGGGIVLCLIPCFMNGGNLAGTFFIIGIILFIIGLIGRVISSSAKKTQTLAYATYNKDSMTLNVNRRGPVMNTILSITEAKNLHLKETPVEVRYAGATVGGVSTGGFYTVGGETVITGSQSSGKWMLNYIDKEIGTGALTQDKKTLRMIGKIQLTPALYEQAKKSNISKYLSGNNTIQVIDSLNLTESEAGFAARNFNSTAAQDILKKGYPSREKCQEILNWLSSSV